MNPKQIIAADCEIPDQHLEIYQMSDEELIEALGENGFGNHTLKSIQDVRTSQCMHILWGKLNVGTKDYEGHSYFWNHEYRHSLRGLSGSCRQGVPDCMEIAIEQMMRKECHDELLKRGLKLDGVSPQHAKIITKHYDRAVNRGEAFMKIMRGEQ